MSRKFTITTPTNLARANAQGQVQVQFTVANTSGTPQRSLFRVVPLGDAKASWLTVEGETERSFAADGVHQISVTAAVPPGTPAGRYGFRVDSLAATRGGEDVEEGPAVYFDVAAPEAQKKSKAWIWILIAVLLLVVAIVTWLLSRPDTPDAMTDTGTTATSTTGTTGNTGPTGTTGATGFRVVETFLRADPFEHTGPCPVTITFTGRISVIGGSGTVSYRFIRNDGAMGPIEALTFDGPGSKDVSTTWMIGASGMNYDGWQAIKIYEPQELESEHAAFRIRCEVPGSVPGR